MSDRTGKQQIIETIQKQNKQFRELHVKRLGLFGSYVRDEAHHESDVDLLVEFEPGCKTFDNFMQLAFLLEDTLQIPIELVTLESLSPYLRPHIMQEVEDVFFSS